MSDFNSYSVRPLVNFKNVLVNGDEYLCRRIVKKGSQETESTTQESKGVLIKKLSRETEFFDYLEQPAIQEAAYNWLLGQVEELVKEQIGQGKEIIYKDSLSAANLNAYLQEKAEKEAISGGRVSKEKIVEWYKAEVAPCLVKAFEAKLGAPLDSSKVKVLTEMYEKVFSKFSARNSYLPKPAWDTCEKVLEVLGDSHMKQYCLGKLPEMKEPTMDEFGL